MKAVQYARYGGPEVLDFVALPDPEPGPGEVLVRVEAASLVPGDWKLRAGQLREIFSIRLPTRSYSVLALDGTIVCLVAAPIENRAAAHGITLRWAEIHDDPAVLRAVLRLAAEGAWRPLVAEVLPLAKARRAHRRIEARRDRRGRIVLTP